MEKISHILSLFLLCQCIHILTINSTSMLNAAWRVGWALFAQIHRIISLVQYVVRGHMGSLYVDFHCSRSSGTPSPFYSLICTQKQAPAKFEK